MSHPKEPKFFIRTPRKSGQKARTMWSNRDPIWYLDIFSGAEDARAIGEASHAYLSSPEAPGALKAYFPDARFVAIFRNPADRAFSLYRWMRNAGLELAPTFELALKVEHRRYHSERFRDDPPQYFWNSMYFSSGLFGSQVERYLRLFPRERFYFTTLSELKNETSAVMAAIYSHIGVDPYPISRAPIANEVPNTARDTKNIARFLQRHGARGAMTLERRFFGRSSGRTAAFRPETRAALMDRYSEDAQLFESLTGIRLLRGE
jgi:Sulfotransferase domain